jgi:hypothetical protein
MRGKWFFLSFLVYVSAETKPFDLYKTSNAQLSPAGGGRGWITKTRYY